MIAISIFLIVFVSSFLPSAFYLSGPILLAAYLVQSKFKFKCKKKTLGVGGIVGVILLFFLLYGSVIGLGPNVTARVFLRFSLYLFIVIVVSYLSRSSIENIFKYMSVTVSLALPFFPLLMYNDYEAQSLRYQFIFVHPNHFAYFLLPLIIYNMSFGNGKRLNILCLIFLGLSLLLTKSSGGVMACLIAVMLHYGIKRQRIVYAILGILVTFPLAVKLGMLDKIHSQISGILEASLETKILEGNFGGGGSLAWRVIYWASIVSSYIDGNVFQKVLGYGFGTMSFGTYVFDFMYTDPHNDFVRILCETGIAGLFILFFGLYWLCHKKIISISLVVPLILFPMFFGNVIVNPSYMVCVFMLIVLNAKIKQEEAPRI